jgi:hypothetical protein
MKSIWNGEGEVTDDIAYYTTADGTIRGRPYVRAYVRRKLIRWNRVTTADERRRAIAATVDNDA